MKLSDFTYEQQLAITAKGTNIIVSAGAGSGKTAVLTQRVLHFIQNEGYRMDEFLILTFTKLASREMKERIRKALRDVKLADANEVDYANITTFDAYALSIVKTYHMLCSVSPDIRIIDTNIISVQKRKIIEEIFSEWYEKQYPSFLEMIQKYAFKDDVELRELVLKISDKANLELDTEAYLNGYVDQYYQDETILAYVHFYTERLKEKVEQLKKEIAKLPAIPISKKERITYQQVVRDYFDTLFSATTYDEYLAGFPKNSFPRIPSGLEEPEKERISTYKEKYKDLKAWIGRLPKSEDAFLQNIQAEIPYVKVFIALVQELHHRIDQYKRQYQVYEFQDIAKMALSIIRENPSVKEEIKSKLKMIMIDEYQDTSLLQETFINMIANQNVYMVGDIKQSIYRFRNAKSDIFAKKYEAYSQNNGGIAIHLNKNFRSRPEVLEDINYVFKQIMTDDFGKADYMHQHRIECGNKNYAKAGTVQETRHSTFILYPHPKNSMNIPIVEANLIANDIVKKIRQHYQVCTFDTVLQKPILRNCQFSDFCILMDRGTNFDVYVKVFHEHKIPIFVENDENIRENDIVCILTNVLRLIKAIQAKDYQSTNFKKAFLSVARSFLYTYSDASLYEISIKNDYVHVPFFIKLKELVITNQDLPIDLLFTKIVYELEIYQKCIRIGNIEKNEKYLDTFLLMFQEMSKLDYTIDDFISYMEYIDKYELKITLSSQETNVDSVKLMNIHKSKGLEFNIVYFSGLKKNFNQMEFKESFGISSHFGLILPPTDPNQICIAKDLHQVDEKREDISEKIRLFYVALTRAKEKMIFVLEEPFFSNFKFTHDLKISKAYYHEKLSKQSKQDGLRILFADYMQGNISKAVFENGMELIQIVLPESVKHIKKEKLQSWNILKLQESIDNYQLCILPFSKQLMQTYHDSFLCVKKAIQMYINQEISLSDLTDIGYALGYTFNKAFYQLAYCQKAESYQETMIEKIVPRATALQESFPLSIQFYNAKHKLEEKCISESTYNQFRTYIDSALKEQAQKQSEDDEPIIFKDVLLRIKNAYTNQQITMNELNQYLELLWIQMPYIHFIEERLVSKPILEKCYVEAAFHYLGFEPKHITQDFFNQYYEGRATNLEVEQFSTYPFFERFSINMDWFDNCLTTERFEGENIFKEIWQDYLNQKITITMVEHILDVLGFQLKIDFKEKGESEKRQVDLGRIDEIIVEKGKILEHREKITNFYQLIYPFHTYRKFEIKIGDIEDTQTFQKEQQAIVHQNLEIKELQFNTEENKRFRASKNLNINSSKLDMEFGTNIHLVMEIIDFQHPDYTIINTPFYITIIKRFLASPLMHNIKGASIYKEYAYFDEEKLVFGIIDLMMVYKDYIDIIDYKTKNINDDAYNKQLEMYHSFVSKKFGKKTNAYLYSLLTGEYKKVI